jgi:hypothetical protein
MSFLSAGQQAAIQTAVQTDETTASLYRSPAASGGKTGARTLHTSSIAIRVRPAGKDDSNFSQIPLANPVNVARVNHLGKVAVDADVRNGDELRIGTTRYLVEGVGTFTNARLLALSEIKGV